MNISIKCDPLKWMLPASKPEEIMSDKPVGNLPKFCKDCAYNREKLYCHHPKVVETTSKWNLVTGDLIFSHAVLTTNGKQTKNCHDLRDESGICGPEANLFEQKPEPDYSCHPA